MSTVLGSPFSTAGIAINKTVNYQSDGIHYYNISSTDNVSNVNSTQSVSFTVDNTAPQITRTAPAVNQISYSNNVTFNMTVTESLGSNAYCYVWIDGQLNYTTNFTGSPVGTQYNWTNLTLSEGSHPWNVSCTDGFNWNTLL